MASDRSQEQAAAVHWVAVDRWVAVADSEAADRSGVVLHLAAAGRWAVVAAAHLRAAVRWRGRDLLY